MIITIPVKHTKKLTYSEWHQKRSRDCMSRSLQPRAPSYLRAIFANSQIKMGEREWKKGWKKTRIRRERTNIINSGLAGDGLVFTSVANANKCRPNTDLIQIIRIADWPRETYYGSLGKWDQPHFFQRRLSVINNWLNTHKDWQGSEFVYASLFRFLL